MYNYSFSFNDMKRARTGIVLFLFFSFLSMAVASPVLGQEKDLSPPEGVDLTLPEFFQNPDGPFTPDPFTDEGAALINEPGNTTESGCFDYYTFQSVQVSVGLDKGSYTPGDTAQFSGEVANENEHPVVDGNVFVRISRVNPNYVTEGNYIIDEFVAVEDVTLGGEASKNIEFSWDVPSVIQSGNYRADFFFSVGKKFNLGGLPFTNEVIIGTAQFNVVDGASGSVQFDRSSTAVNGDAYTHIGDWKEVERNSEVTIKQPLRNSFSSEEEVAVTYDLFFWGGLNDENKVASADENVTIPGNSAHTLTYTIPEMEDTVYYLRIMAEYADTKSIVNIRVVSEGGHPRLNYVSLTQFPIEDEDTFSIFSCFHNTGNNITETKTVTLTLYDGSGNVIDLAEQVGPIAPNMMVLAKEIIATERYDVLRLTAEIEDENGATIDAYTAHYNCADFDACPQEEQRDTGKALDTIAPFVVFGVLLLGLGIVFIQRRRGGGLEDTVE